MNERATSARAVVILSGGLDSTTCMGMAQADGYELYPITFDYGQRQRNEIVQAEAVANYYGCGQQHKIIALPFLGDFGGSSLTDERLEVPQGDVANEEIPNTYVPGRNLLFLSIAASYAEAIGAKAIFIGVNDVDYSGYPDCRPEFIAKFADVVAYATKAGVTGETIRIETPIISMSKAEIIQQGIALGVPYELTTSCYIGEERACGQCDSCLLRLKGFAEAGKTDPIAYV